VDNTLKLQTAEQKMGELTSAMAVLGKEAAAAMTAVEAQQQRLTLQRLIAMVEAERSYHQRIAEILDQLQAQMVSERQRSESNSTPGGNAAASDMYMPPPSYEDVKSNGGSHNASDAAPVSKAAQKAMYFLAEVASSTCDTQISIYCVPVMMHCDLWRYAVRADCALLYSGVPLH
jgi:hypothetical protein